MLVLLKRTTLSSSLKSERKRMGLFKHLRSRPGLSTALGIAFAVIAGLTLLGYVSKAMKGDRGGSMVNIPVVRRDIAMGSVITDDMLANWSVPRDYVVPGALRSRSDVVGSRALRFIGKGEPVTASAIAGGKGAANLATRIPPDMRAYTILLSRSSAGTADLRPGDKVDVLSTGGEPPRTATLLTGRLILSVGNLSGQGPEEAPGSGAPAITLLVAPREAELLAQAVCSGEISVSLCPAEEKQQSGVQGSK
jgi:Flp pilus assembly protein CpaB